MHKIIHPTCIMFHICVRAYAATRGKHPLFRHIVAAGEKRTGAFTCDVSVLLRVWEGHEEGEEHHFKRYALVKMHKNTTTKFGKATKLLLMW